MPKRTDIKKILIIGAGPIVIGQACEFDYSGTQACKALKEEGYEVVLINSNPATIMTDPGLADMTYIEPVIPEVVEKIIEKERPDALLPTMGGQTALNIAVSLAESGVLKKYNVELIGAKLPAIKKAEDRELFKEAMERIGLEVPRSGYAKTITDALSILETMSYPVIIRPSFTLGGTGGGIAYNAEEFKEMVQYGLDASPYSEILIEESVIGWKEYELEVMRDTKDNVVIICSIENFDPMGVHTGDSITVAPAQTLTDKEYQIMRDAALKIIREIGVDTGGSNIQFSVNPDNGKICIIEMNPRVSRSSALASKATGFPIAKIAAKLAVGYTLDEIPNDITKKTPASFEPTIDYVVTKIPRFTFEKFPQADATLTTQMKSVGEVMAIGRTFKESLQKAMRSLEIGSYGFEIKKSVRYDEPGEYVELIKEKLRVPNWERLWYTGDAFRCGMTVDEIFELSKIDRWFLNNIKEIVGFEEEIRKQEELSPDLLRQAKELGFSDRRIAQLWATRKNTGAKRCQAPAGKEIETKEYEIRKKRVEAGILPAYKTVDTCGAEFEAHTPYLYSSYERPFYTIMEGSKSPQPPFAKGGQGGISECEANPTNRKKVVILGSGPNRIGQGIEFDYCCVHASFALKEEGIETIMVNCNPETVSTDYDTSDRLYFEPLTFEDVMNIIEKEKPFGVIVQFGGQTPLKLAKALKEAGVNILGTSPDSIDIAEDRFRFRELLNKLQLRYPEGFDIRPNKKAFEMGIYAGIDGLAETHYPIVVRPSYVLGGRAMAIVYNQAELHEYLKKLIISSDKDLDIYADRFLNDAIEVDVDCVSDGKDVVIGGIMEHIEEAGIHSGDSACSIPPYSLGVKVIDDIRKQTIALAKELKVIGLMNIQFAVKKTGSRGKGQGTEECEIYVLEVNPRASRTVPFVSKAIGKPLAKIAAKAMLGKTLKELRLTEEIVPQHTSVKEAVFPFIKFPGVDTILGPEMKSTGEVMGIDADFGKAFAKAQIAAGNKLPMKGNVFISVKGDDKKNIAEIAKQLSEMGFHLIATSGTADYLKGNGIGAELIYKVGEGRPHIVDRIKSGEIAMVINTSFGAKAVTDSYSIRRSALVYNVPYFTTVAGAKAAAQGITSLIEEGLKVRPIQEYHSEGRIQNIEYGIKAL
ncbi:MAG: carbamoyl phosphate synthase large subunit [Deltaproteobacteria bacterium RIFCSPLOWO2_12_FULL_43_16]|nr:MAG: carbamoyl phosphate synthase large subunit [Deltaproteobacteria bacterium GWA2_43_19]OGQ12980.1 MAG: carbamoyl phosphate synthase large subunit [Deltaproteobacteria bacterium RIFCSPHIGHO2_02_FULL_43_33]OGQ58402.1 MAG: carbamoyl phosphate synthase large subunit [Deltaproteobacteria bacterium RIFCSPLOWO2_12_FULL_43_16]